MKSYFAILIIFCLSGVTLSSNLSKPKDGLLSGMFSKITSFFGRKAKIIGDSDPIFKNLPFELQRDVGIEIIKFAALSLERVPQPIPVLDALIKEYKIRQDGVNTQSVIKYFGLLKKLIDESEKLFRAILKAIDKSFCRWISKEECTSKIFKLKENWNRISKHAKNLIKTMPRTVKYFPNLENWFKDIYRSVKEKREIFDIFCFQTIKAPVIDDHLSFTPLMEEAVTLMHRQARLMKSEMLDLYENEEDLVSKVYRISKYITSKIDDAEKLRSYLTEDGKGLKLSDIICLFKERVQKFRKITKDKNRPVMPVIDELPEPEGIEDDEQMQAFKSDLNKNESLNETETDLPPKDDRGFFGRLIGVLTQGFGRD